MSHWISRLSVRTGQQEINIKMMMMMVITVPTITLAVSTGWALIVCQEQSQWLYRWNLPETGDVSFPSSLSSHTSSSSAGLTKSASWFPGNCRGADSSISHGARMMNTQVWTLFRGWPESFLFTLPQLLQAKNFIKPGLFISITRNTTIYLQGKNVILTCKAHVIL